MPLDCYQYKMPPPHPTTRLLGFCFCSGAAQLLSASAEQHGQTICVTKLTSTAVCACLPVQTKYEDNASLFRGTIRLQLLGFSSRVCGGRRPTVGTRRYLLAFGWRLVAVCVCVCEGVLVVGLGGLNRTSLFLSCNIHPNVN